MDKESERVSRPQQTPESQPTGLITRFSKTRDGRIFFIREGESMDAGHLLEFLEQASAESDYLTFGPGEFGATVEQEESLLKSALGSPLRLFLIAVLNDAIIGNLAIWTPGRPRLKHMGELGMAVLRPYWGLAVGSSLLDCALDWVRSNAAIVKVNLRVRADNQRAIALYQSRGFDIEGTIRKEIYMAGRFYDSHIMGLEPS